MNTWAKIIIATQDYNGTGLWEVVVPTGNVWKIGKDSGK